MNTEYISRPQTYQFVAAVRTVSGSFLIIPHVIYLRTVEVITSQNGSSEVLQHAFSLYYMSTTAYVLQCGLDESHGISMGLIWPCPIICAPMG